jgi:hypothetical protein
MRKGEGSREDRASTRPAGSRAESKQAKGHSRMLRLKSENLPGCSEGVCLRRQRLLSAVKGDFLLWPPVLLKSVDRQLKKVKNETVIEFWRLRIAEDVIKVVYHWGQIPDCSPFVVRTIHSWVRNSKAHFLVDLGKALARGRRLPKVQTFPYVLMNRAYSTLTGCYPAENPLRRENEILVEISRLYGLTTDQVKEILFLRARFHPLEYVSPFKSTSAKKVRALEWKCWETFLDLKAKGARTDREAIRLAARRKGCSEEKVRGMIQQVKQILEVQHTVRVIRSDGDLSKIAEEHFMRWKSESLPKSLFPAKSAFSLPEDTL